VNLVVTAVWNEYGARLAGLVGLEPTLARALSGWAVLIISWLIVTLAVPTSSDNRPRLDEAPPAELEEVMLP
jgi:hypothetical protein